MTEQVKTINGVEPERLMTIVGAVKENPDLGKTMWRANTRWIDGFRSEAHIRGFTIPMDESTDLAGTNTAPNMVEVVLGAYGCCLQTGYAMNAAVMDAVRVPPSACSTSQSTQRLMSGIL